MSEADLPPSFNPPPRGEDLPYDDGEPLETERHVKQMTLLIESLRTGWKAREDFYVGGNMFLYYSALQARRNDFRGPDVFVALGVDPHERKSWVLWEEDGKRPDVIIEITSPSTAHVDHGEKMRIYGPLLNVGEYFIFDPFSGELEGYRYDVAKTRYLPIEPVASGRLPSTALGLELGRVESTYHERTLPWLRWIWPDGRVVPHLGEERDAAVAERDAVQAERDAVQAERDAVQAERDAVQAERDELAARLAALEAQLREKEGE